VDQQPLPRETPSIKRVRRLAGVFGILVAAALVLWIPAGLVPGVPGPIDVFGIDGLRIPASFAVGGLVLGAIGFFEP
jgi:hypothetical protein